MMQKSQKVAGAAYFFYKYYQKNNIRNKFVPLPFQ